MWGRHTSCPGTGRHALRPEKARGVAAARASEKREDRSNIAFLVFGPLADTLLGPLSLWPVSLVPTCSQRRSPGYQHITRKSHGGLYCANHAAFVGVSPADWV